MRKKVKTKRMIHEVTLSSVEKIRLSRIGYFGHDKKDIEMRILRKGITTDGQIDWLSTPIRIQLEESFFCRLLEGYLLFGFDRNLN